jgi:hypothetical protein
MAIASTQNDEQKMNTQASRVASSDGSLSAATVRSQFDPAVLPNDQRSCPATAGGWGVVVIVEATGADRVHVPRLAALPR